MEEAVVYWTRFYALTSLGTGVVLLVTLALVFGQLRRSGKNQELQGFVQVVNWLQQEEVRIARRRLYKLKDVPYDQWTREDVLEAEKVCHNFNTVGDMIKNGLISSEVVESWGWVIKRCWAIAMPLVYAYRNERNYPKVWSTFEWLAEEVRWHDE